MNNRKANASIDNFLPEEPLLSLEECREQLMKFVKLKSRIKSENATNILQKSNENNLDLTVIHELFDSLEIKAAHQWATSNHSQSNIFTEHVFGGQLHLNESDPLPCADNYSVIFRSFPKSQPSTDITNMIHLASSYICGFTKFALDLENKSFEDISHKTGQKLSIAQYYNFFSTARVSKKVEEQMEDSQFFSEKFADFIIVVYQGHMFKLKVMERSTTQTVMLPVDKIMESLYWIVKWGQQKSSEHKLPLTVITQAARKDIQNIKQHLIGIGQQNATNLNWINESLFMVVLDDTSEVQETAWKDGIAMSSQHRQAFNYSDHIWYEKAITLVVTHSGTCGINFEHSFSDSGPAHVMASAVYQYALKLYQSGLNTELANPSTVNTNVEILQWTVDNHITESLNTIHQQLQAKVQSKQAVDFSVAGIGSTSIKHLGLSPDSFFQVCLAWALYKYHNRIPFNLETIDSRMFKNSRLFVVPTLTAELVEFLFGSSSDSTQRTELLRKSIVAHKTLTQHSMDKQGFYLYFSLFLLNELELRDNPPHPFTQTEFYKQIFTFDCVSSNVGDFLGIEEVLSGFPAQHEEGMLVVGYIIKTDSIFVTITSNDHSKELGLLIQHLKMCLLESFEELKK